MQKNDYPTRKSAEERYRDYMKDVNKWDAGTGKIDLEDMMVAVNKTPAVKMIVEKLLLSPNFLNIVVEGSATPQNNVEAINRLLAFRDNPKDRVIVFDISRQAVVDHQKYLSQHGLDDQIIAVKTSMLKIDLPDNVADFILNDCAINYSDDADQMRQTLIEIKRLLRSPESICLLNIAVDHRYDSIDFGTDQEKVPSENIEETGHFSVLPEPKSEQRQCWTVPFIKQVLKEIGFRFVEFDEKEGRSRFSQPSEYPISYRRFVLQKVS